MVDIKCAACGPKLVNWLKEVAVEKQLGDEDVRVWPCSHVGGHRYAGNALVYPAGDWWGHINSLEEARALLSYPSTSDHKSPPHESLRKNWRGRIGMNEIEQEELVR
jgi:hypothetical protein